MSFVEFQRNYSMALKVHREALNAIRAFWDALQHPTVHFQVMATAIKNMDVASKCVCSAMPGCQQAL